jgi:hypothetical protein
VQEVADGDGDELEGEEGVPEGGRGGRRGKKVEKGIGG